MRLRRLDRAGRRGPCATRTSASNRRTASTKRAAGRACRPIALRTSSTVCASAGRAPPAPASAAAPAAPRRPPAARLFIASAPRASAATSSSDAPPRAATAAATAPSTSGASLSTHASRRVAEHLDRELGAHQRAAEVHQHEHAVGGHRPLDRRPDALGVGAEDAGLLHAAGGLERQLLAAHLARERDDALGQRVAMGDDDDPDHAQPSEAVGAMQIVDRVHRLLARWRGSICQRQVSLSHADTRWRRTRGSARTGPAPDLHRDVVLLRLQPVGPGDPAAAAFALGDLEPGIRASSSSAGLPIQWPCCWHGAW